LLHESGFILVNDYGPVRLEDVASHMGVQRFGGSVALGLSFPLLEQTLIARALTVMSPEGDEKRRIHTRLIAREVGEQAQEAFRSRFRLETDTYLDAPIEEARRHVAAGRTNEALAAYRVVVERSPRDWQLLGEAAEYAGLQLRDYTAGLELARAALERNPWCSAWLWNVLGDCLFCKEKCEEAHVAYEQAQRIDPDDPRTNLNLAYTFAARSAMNEALAAIARGLAQDGRGRGAYRARLLEKQGQILAILSERASAEQERLVKRAERFR
jgi:tetratricopeptide (TPR) repeat protein